MGQDQWPEPEGQISVVTNLTGEFGGRRFCGRPGYRWWLGELEKNEGGIEKFAEGYKIFGWNRDDEKGRNGLAGMEQGYI